MILSEFSIKELKGNQELSLIELSSAPLKEGETIEDRNKLAQDAHILNQESACEGILEGMSYEKRIIRIALNDGFAAISKAQNAEAKLKAMLLEAQTFESQIESSKEESIRNVQLSLEHFNVKLKEYIAQSDVIRKKVTNDYLVLRHNARVAEKILCERRQTAVLAREQMQRNMDLLVKDSSRRRAEVEESLVSEQARLLHEARESVMTKESQVRALAVRTAAKLRDAKKGRAELKGSIKKYEDLYRKLEKRREKEVRSISAELKVFRDMISAVEMKLSIKA